MKKQNKKEQQMQPKSWKVWFYTLWVPIIVCLIFLLILLSIRLVRLPEVGCLPSDDVCSFKEEIDIVLHLMWPFFAIFMLYHFIYFISRFFTKKEYFSWKIFCGTTTLLFITICLLKLWSN